MKKYLLSIALLLLVAGGVHADTKYHSISTAAFGPAHDTQSYWRGWKWFYATNVIGANEFYAPVCLPDSVKIVEFKAYVYDAHGSLDIYASMDAVRLDTIGAANVIAAVVSSGASGIQGLTDNTIDHIVDNATYKYDIGILLPSGDSTNKFLGVSIKYETTFGKEESKAVVPQRFDISQNRPNPSSGVTHITYQLPNKSKVSLKVYDSSGRIVRTLVDGEQDAGHYTSTWYGKDNSTQTVPNGNYFYRLNIDGKAVTKKAILLK